MASLQCGTPSGRILKQHAASRSRQSRSVNIAVRSQISPVQAARQVRDAAASSVVSVSLAALLLALPANAAAPTLFDSNSTYQQELQDLVEKRGGLSNFKPQDAVKKAVDAASDKASDAADSAKFTLNKDLPISKGTIDAPDTILNQALPEAAKNLPPPPSPPADLPSLETPETPKAEAPSLPEPPKVDTPSLPSLPKVDTLKLEAPKLDIPKPPTVPTPSVPTPSIPTPSIPTPQAPDLPQQPGGGLPTPYLAAGGAAALAIVGIGLAGAKPDNASPAEPATGGSSSSSSSQSKSSSKGSSSGLPEGKDPELDSEVAKKKDPFFKEVDKRT